MHFEAANLRHQLEVVQSELATVRQELEAASRKAREEKRDMEATTASFTEQLAAKGGCFGPGVFAATVVHIRMYVFMQTCTLFLVASVL